MNPAAPLVFDVAVVGSGPAGSVAAHALSRGGLRVALIEKAVLPRYKTCGGGLLARTLKRLPIDVTGVVESECFLAEMHDHRAGLAYSTRRDTPVVSMVMRDTFDHLLASAAQREGTELFAGTAVRDVGMNVESVSLATTAGEVKARYLVAADGVMSTVARKCGFPELRGVIPALECELKVDAATQERYASAARFDFGVTPRGYGWVFPKRGHLSVGVLTTRRGCCNLNDEYVRYAARLGLDKPISEERQGYMIPGRPRDQLFSRSRIFLVGDAAGLADPVTAEGISAAVISGQLAAQAILAHRENAESAMRAYRVSLEETILSELAIARILARGVYDFPRLRSWLFKRQGQRLCEFVTDVVMGTARYRDAVRRPKNYFRIIFGGKSG